MFLSLYLQWPSSEKVRKVSEKGKEKSLNLNIAQVQYNMRAIR